MPTEIELELEQTQQGSSNEVSVSTEGVEELKRNDMRKGEKKLPSYYSTLGQKPGSTHLLLVVTTVAPVLKTSRHGPSDALHQNFLNHSSSLKRACFILTGNPA